MTTVNQYRFFCSNENAYVYVWATEPPTKCPNDLSEKIFSTTIVSAVSPVIAEPLKTVDNAPEAGWYQSTRIKMEIPKGSDIVTYDWRVPFDMYIWSASLMSSILSEGDTFSLVIGPDTNIGSLVKDVSAKETTINIGSDSPAFYYITKGIECSISDTKTVNYLGRITAYDRSEGTITFEVPLSNDFPIESALRFSNYPIKDFIMDGTTNKSHFAEKGLRAKCVPANTPMQLIYKTLTETPKNIYFQIEYYMT